MSKRYIVAYDLHEESSSDYKKIEKAIQNCGDSVRIQESVWLVASSLGKKELFNKVSAPTDKNDDKVFVALIRGTSYQNLNSDVSDFLSRNPSQ